MKQGLIHVSLHLICFHEIHIKHTKRNPSTHLAIHSIYSFWVHSLLLLLLILVNFRFLLEEHKDVKGFTTDAVLLTATTATCSWFCTILLEFSSLSLCKISFSSSSNARLLSSVLNESRRNVSNVKRLQVDSNLQPLSS